VTYAGEGEIRFQAIEQHGKRGLMVIASDRGPGIPDLAQAMQDGYSSGAGLGLGLPGARRLMDRFEINSRVGVGTTVVMTKWAR
ncbi:MAG: ATP-binding protein, partial [Acidimicrobiaceae bacterium]|nr:ATP-binding protein [Acidimicrobiaceae bacterium]